MRDTEEVHKLFGREAALPLGNVGWDGDSGSADLCGQAINFILRPTPRHGVHQFSQLHRLFPGYQLSITTYRPLLLHPPYLSSLLFTVHCSLFTVHGFSRPCASSSAASSRS